jgi:7-cyano-7-deazaguanine reductase
MAKKTPTKKSMKTIVPAAYVDPKQKLYGQTAVEEAELERFPNRTLVRRYEIEFTCPEFTCLCPRSGFPDFATIYIRYVPDQWCVELKSLKLYINKFRNDKIFHEDVTNNILDDLVELLDPWEIEVVGDFNVRGNIATVITSTHFKEAKNGKKSKA